VPDTILERDRQEQQRRQRPSARWRHHSQHRRLSPVHSVTNSAQAAAQGAQALASERRRVDGTPRARPRPAPSYRSRRAWPVRVGVTSGPTAEPGTGAAAGSDRGARGNHRAQPPRMTCPYRCTPRCTRDVAIRITHDRTGGRPRDASTMLRDGRERHGRAAPYGARPADEAQRRAWPWARDRRPSSCVLDECRVGTRRCTSAATASSTGGQPRRLYGRHGRGENAYPTPPPSRRFRVIGLLPKEVFIAVAGRCSSRSSLGGWPGRGRRRCSCSRCRSARR